MEKYCTNCGELIPNRSKYCPICGERQGKKREYKNNYYNENFSHKAEPKQQIKTTKTFQSFNYTQKKPIIIMVPFILILPGLGHILAGQKQKGKTIMVITFTLMLFAIIIPLATEFYFTIYFLNPIIAFLFLGAFVDGIRQLRKHNKSLKQQELILSQKIYTAQ